MAFCWPCSSGSSMDRRGAALPLGRGFKEFAAISALPGLRQNLLGTEGTPFCRLLDAGRRRGSPYFGLAAPHGFQFRIRIDNALLGTRRFVATIRADFRVLADATRALWAFHATGKGQRKSDGTQQDAKDEPRATVFPPISGNDGGTDAKQEPDCEECHNVRVYHTSRSDAPKKARAEAVGALLIGKSFVISNNTLSTELVLTTEKKGRILWS